MKLFWASLLLLLNCGDNLNIDTNVVIKMNGVLEAPADAPEDSYEPYFQEITLKSISAFDENDKETILFESTGLDLRISNRDQIIFSKKIEESEEGLVYQKLHLTFDTEYSMTSKYKTEKFYLETGVISYERPFTIPTGHNIVFLLKLKWKNTVQRDLDNSEDTIIAPEFEIIHEN